MHPDFFLVVGLWNAKEWCPPIPGSLHLLTAIEPRPQDVNERGDLTLARMQGGPCGAVGWVLLFVSDCFQATNRVIALNHWQGSNFRFLGTLCRHSSHSLLTNRLRSRPRRTSQVLPKERVSVLKIDLGNTCQSIFSSRCPNADSADSSKFVKTPAGSFEVGKQRRTTCLKGSCSWPKICRQIDNQS